MKIELNSEGIQALLHSQELSDGMLTIAEGIVMAAGDGYEVDLYNAGTRNIVGISTATQEAYKDNLENNTLLTALGEGGTE